MSVISKVLVANRGEIACRAIRACDELSLPCVAIFTEPDAASLHVLQAPESICIGTSSREYLNADRILEIAKATGVNAIFPGYGFLSENAEFAEKCELAGIAFIGPTASTMRKFSQKHSARALAQAVGVPVVPGSELLRDADDAVAMARAIGLPVMLKATGGGGGIGIHICHSEAEVHEKFISAARQGSAAFGEAGVFMEKYVQRARHIEVQIFGNGQGDVVTFPERECSIQRRHQKVLEETPSPFVGSRPELRLALSAAARSLGKAVSYRSAGTVEFIVDDDTGKFYFLEVNTRLQVEHGITEMVSGVDLVAWQLQLQGAPCPEHASLRPGSILPVHLDGFSVDRPSGHAIEVRVCAEDPAHDYRPSTGVLGEVVWPHGDGIRVDTWVETGSEITAYYDSLIAKIMVHNAVSRGDTISDLQVALAKTTAKGVTTNLSLLRDIAASPDFQSGSTTTSFLTDFQHVPQAIEVVEPGLMTTVQDWPGRVGYWSVGVPPSGPMDDLSHRMANALVGNADSEAALEVTLAGPTLRFHVSGVVAVTGADAPVMLNGEQMPQWTSLKVNAGDILSVGTTSGGSRAYIAMAGGLDVPQYLGSKATFPGGTMGGHQGRALRAGDLIPLCGANTEGLAVGVVAPLSWRPTPPEPNRPWQVGVLPGPQEAPDYFTEEDVVIFYETTFKVHHNSNRLGIRLEGPRPQFARSNGGEGGSHPSNVHDHVYAIGTVNYTGDMPVVLTVDGPSLGGFVCPATIITTEQYKMGWLRPGDGIKFVRVSIEDAVNARLATNKMIDLLRAIGRGELMATEGETALASFVPSTPPCPPTSAVLWTLPASSVHPGAQLRLAGDRYVFLEYGPMELDLNLRVRVSELQTWISKSGAKGIVETSPGVRSVMIEYDQTVLSLTELIELIKRAEQELPPATDVQLNVRVLHLPLAFEDRWTKEAISRYARSVRSEAPYLPSNVDFIAANNGLEGQAAAAVRNIVFSASYVVLGLGDVYLGAPCAVPLDPRHRLVVPKYNPARTYTPEGGVGIGGCYMCIYGMDSPGGYQLIGRTLPIWNGFTRTGPFEPGRPWLLRNFDQVRYFEVSEGELEQMRKDFTSGRLDIKIEEEVLDMAAYNAMLVNVAAEVEEMKTLQRLAMEEQMRIDVEHLARIDSKASLKCTTNDLVLNGGGLGTNEHDDDIDASNTLVRAAVAGTVWEMRASVGDEVSAGDTLLVLEAMKMEYAVSAPVAGRVIKVHVETGDMVYQGGTLCIVGPLK